MLYYVCYRFSEKGKWFIYKDATEATVGDVVNAAYRVDGVCEVKVVRREKKEKRN